MPNTASFALLWERLQAGLHTALLGAAPPEPPQGSKLRLIRLACDVHSSIYSLALEACREVEGQLGASGGMQSFMQERLWTGLRRKLLDEMSDQERSGVFVDSLNRLSDQGPFQYVLCFEAVECADTGMLGFLRDLLAHRGWLRLPVVLSFGTTTPTGNAARVLEVLVLSQGPDAVLQVESAPTAELASLPELPREVLRVLRGASVVGRGFDAELVASLLEIDPLKVLELLQWAEDLGVPLEDLGGGRFRMPEEAVRGLQQSLLPSLRQAWHQRLGGLLSAAPQPGGPEAEAEAEAETAPAEAAAAPEPELPAAAGTPSEAAETEAPAAEEEAAPPAETSEAEEGPAAGDEPGTARSGDDLATARIPFKDLLKSSADELAAMSHSGVDAQFIQSLLDAAQTRPPAETPAGPSEVAGDAQEVQPDASKAATHYAAAGDWDQSAQRYLDAAHQAARLGAAEAALAYCQKGLDLLEGRPSSAGRRRLRIGLLAEQGRLQWQAAGFEAAFRLPEALNTLNQAAAALQEDDPAPLRVEIGTLIANVCYELGDSASLERALQELTTASRALLTAQDPTGAARLLNDQAAVWVRLGDPVQAAYLLEKSRQVFEARSQSDPVTMIELAETHHLLARLPLHVRARKGRELDALEIGLEHARKAERNYTQLKAHRELGRVWETMARLELRAGNSEQSSRHLQTASQVQQDVGDVLGLARTTAALAEVLSSVGRHREALELLGDSVTLNMEKGSPLGLAYNRRGYEHLLQAVPDEERASLTALLQGIQTRLEDAEARLGKVNLPESELA